MSSQWSCLAKCHQQRAGARRRPKCCANFICKLWQKRGLYANFDSTRLRLGIRLRLRLRLDSAAALSRLHAALNTLFNDVKSECICQIFGECGAFTAAAASVAVAAAAAVRHRLCLVFISSKSVKFWRNVKAIFRFTLSDMWIALLNLVAPFTSRVAQLLSWAQDANS